MLWTPQDLAAATGAAPRVPFAASGISIDSRSVRPGDLFVALQDVRDGHDFVADALAKGAAGALIRNGALDLPADAAVIEVADPLTSLTDLAKFARARFTGKLVAITGSVGKTTTKEMLRTALGAAGKVHAAAASFNNHIGVPLTLALLPPDADFAVIEIGMNHPGEITPLAVLARPHVALITNIGSAHIGHMGSLAAIAAEKAAIFGGLVQNGTAIIPLQTAEYPILEAAALASGAGIIRAGEGGEAELLSKALDQDGSDLFVRIGERQISLRLGAAGRHMATNAVAVLAAAGALGADIAQAAAALAHFTPAAGRGARLAILGGTATVLDESYNASTLSVRAALALLDLSPAERRIAVLGDMREMGEHAAAEHQSLAPDVEEHADMLFTCGPLMRHLHDAVPARIATAHTETSAELAPMVARAIKPGDLVLVKGSFGSKMRLVVETLTKLGSTA